MFRPILALGAIAFAAVPAAASNYSATLAVPATARVIARDISWNCGPAACQGSTEESCPAVLCQSLAKRAGRIDSFLVDGRAFTAAELDGCNAFARAAPKSALAAK